MSLKKIKAMLKEVIGLYPNSIGDASIERAIHHRMQAVDIRSFGFKGEMEYLLRIKKDSKEFDELVEEVVVPETWFFRNIFPFEALASYLPGLKNKRPGDENAELKILSLPCSTGEEPYSIAMVLMEKDLPIGKFSIDALDISQRAIRKAKRGIYGRHSFREEYRGLREKYFQRTQAGYVLAPKVKEKVKFSRANIITDNLDYSQQAYDVIFCRNLLIYFDRQTQACVLKKLYRMLKPKGILCVGHAEAAQVTKSHFISLDISMAFAFSKIDDAIETSFISRSVSKKISTENSKALKNLESTFQSLVGLVEKDQEMSNRLSRNRALTQVPAENNRRVKKLPKVSKEIQENMQDEAHARGVATLKKISGYLDLGRLNDAAILCESYLKNNPESTDAYYYLGLISHQKGSPGAAESLLKKALYLDPDHHLAIGLLALLAEERGDAGQAEDYRRRQKRAINRNSSTDG